MESVATVETHCKASPFPPRLGSLRLPHFPQPRRRIYLQTINPGGGSFLLDRGGLFLRCQSDKRTGEALYEAIGYFEQALEKDPSYALAYSGLADTYAVMPSYSDLSRMDAAEKASEAARRALAIVTL